MEYVYAAMLIHKSGKKADEATVTAVLKAAGVEPDATRVKALIAALENVNIDEAIEKAAVVQTAAPAAAPAEGGSGEAKKEDKKADAAEEKKKEEEAAAGLGALFG
jgi:large subunit ribosomal protein L12